MLASPRLGHDEHALHLSGLGIEQPEGSASDGLALLVGDEDYATLSVGTKFSYRRGLEAAEADAQLGEVQLDEAKGVGVIRGDLNAAAVRVIHGEPKRRRSTRATRRRGHP